jgi:hypothetical protein
MRRQPQIHHAMEFLLVSASVALLAGCAAQVGGVTGLPAQTPRALPVDVRLEPCIDRTETQGRTLALDATHAFDEKIRATKEFVVREGARFKLACEGSAVKRWILPGWGATAGQVSAMLTDTTTGEIVIIARGNATVAGGGLYTIGADTYIVASAVDEVVRQLSAWATGESSTSEDPKGKSERKQER